MTQLPPHDLSALALALRSARARGRGRTSGVFQWMQQNEAALAGLIAGCGADWALIAAEIAAAGVRNGDGKAPTPEGCRKTWQRVRARLVTRAGKAEVAVRVVAPAAVAPAVVAPLAPAAAPARPDHAPPTLKPRYADDDRSPAAETWRRVQEDSRQQNDRRMAILLGPDWKTKPAPVPVAPVAAEAPAAEPAPAAPLDEAAARRMAEAARATIRATLSPRMTAEQKQIVAEALATAEALEAGRPVPGWIGKSQMTLDESLAADMAEFAVERMRVEAEAAEAKAGAAAPAPEPAPAKPAPVAKRPAWAAISPEELAEMDFDEIPARYREQELARRKAVWKARQEAELDAEYARVHAIASGAVKAPLVYAPAPPPPTVEPAAPAAVETAADKAAEERAEKARAAVALLKKAREATAAKREAAKAAKATAE
jgi:hypothetical protein